MNLSVEYMLDMFAKIRKLYIEEFARVFKEENFSPNEINILIFLYNNPTIDTSSQLYVVLGVSKGLVSRSIDSLLKKGYLKSYIDSKDKRIQHLVLTDQVEPIIERVKSIKDNINKLILMNIPKEDIAITQKTLMTIQDRFQQYSLERGFYHENV